MDSMSAFAMGQASKGRPLMVFDWDKAAELIKERQPIHASAGLAQDWKCTGGTIYQDGKPDTESYTYLASTWATPELDMDGEVVECFRMEDTVPESWTGELNDIKWPQSALDILNGVSQTV